MSQTLMSHLLAEEIDCFKSDLPFLYNLLGYQKPDMNISPSVKNILNDRDMPMQLELQVSKLN